MTTGVLPELTTEALTVLEPTRWLTARMSAPMAALLTQAILTLVLVATPLAWSGDMVPTLDMALRDSPLVPLVVMDLEASARADTLHMGDTIKHSGGIII